MKKADKDQIIKALEQKGVRDLMFKKDGSIRAMRGYYWRGQGGTVEELKAKVLLAYPKAEILDSGDQFTDFRGGAPIHKQSHIYVIFKINLEVTK